MSPHLVAVRAPSFSAAAIGCARSELAGADGAFEAASSTAAVRSWSRAAWRARRP